MNSRTLWLWLHWFAVFVFAYSFVQVAVDIVFYEWYHYWYDLISFSIGATYAGLAFIRLWNKKD